MIRRIVPRLIVRLHACQLGSRPQTQRGMFLRDRLVPQRACLPDRSTGSAKRVAAGSRPETPRRRDGERVRIEARLGTQVAVERTSEATEAAAGPSGPIWRAARPHVT